jgi:hypothetical protein
MDSLARVLDLEKGNVDLPSTRTPAIVTRQRILSEPALPRWISILRGRSFRAVVFGTCDPSCPKLNISHQQPYSNERQSNPTLAAGIDVDTIHSDHSIYNEENGDLYASSHRPANASDGFDWDNFDFGVGIGDTEQTPVDPELQALLDTILQPHLNIGLGGYDTGFALP